MGREIRKKVLSRLAPVARAASSNEILKFLKADLANKYTNGKVFSDITNTAPEKLNGENI